MTGTLSRSWGCLLPIDDFHDLTGRIETRKQSPLILMRSRLLTHCRCMAVVLRLVVRAVTLMTASGAPPPLASVSLMPVARLSRLRGRLGLRASWGGGGGPVRMPQHATGSVKILATRFSRWRGRSRVLAAAGMVLAVGIFASRPRR